MAWEVIEPKKIKKQVERLPPVIQEAYKLLLADLKNDGPEQPSWHHYSKLVSRKGDPERHHCHLNKGKPRYVVVWRLTSSRLKAGDSYRVQEQDNTPESPRWVPASTRLPRGKRLGFRRNIPQCGEFYGCEPSPYSPQCH